MFIVISTHTVTQFTSFATDTGRLMANTKDLVHTRIRTVITDNSVGFDNDFHNFHKTKHGYA